MERRPRRGARGGARSAPGPAPAPRTAAPGRSEEPQGSQLWLFPSAAGLRGALPQRIEATRQMCCTRERLVVLERGGAGVEVHQLPTASDGAKKPSEWGGQCPHALLPRDGGVRVGGRGTVVQRLRGQGRHRRLSPEHPDCETGRRAQKGPLRHSGPRWSQKRAGWLLRLARTSP